MDKWKLCKVITITKNWMVVSTTNGQRKGFLMNGYNTIPQQQTKVWTKKTQNLHKQHCVEESKQLIQKHINIKIK